MSTNISDVKAAKSGPAGWLNLFAVCSYENMGMRKKMKEKEFARGEGSRLKSLKTR